MTPLLRAILSVALCSGSAALLAPWLLRRATEPELEPGEAKIPYAALATRRTAVAAAAWAGALALVAVLAVEPARLGPWLVLAVAGALASVVDIATTWIPRRWLHLAWLAAALAVVGSAWSVGDWSGVLRAALGLAVIGGAYGLVYLLSLWLDRGFFGLADVRLGVLTGMVSGWRSVPTATSALVLGSLVGALWGVANLPRQRDVPYAYGPGIVLGPYGVLLITLVTGR
ncbi:MAG TPA: hypothetical protein VFK68_04970 [Propionibacteriaceae bacterium]|nr:hypothetical protein [Propionibacteriaceae bacterium]